MPVVVVFIVSIVNHSSLRQLHKTTDPALVQILASQEKACVEITLLLDILVCSRIYQCQIQDWVHKDGHIMPPNYYGIRVSGVAPPSWKCLHLTLKHHLLYDLEQGNGTTLRKMVPTFWAGVGFG